MLALPLITGASGFWPSFAYMVVCWVVATCTALLYAEASLWLPEGAHVITMTSKLLGPFVKGLAWLLYLFICFGSLAAYAAGAGSQIAVSIGLPLLPAVVVFIAIFTFIIYLGSRFVGRINTILVLAMVAAYGLLVFFGVDEVKKELLIRQKWQGAWQTIPLFLTSFSFQTMVPSLTPYLNRHLPSLRLAIIGGTTLTFGIYLVWQWLILGIVPLEGPSGLAQAYAEGEPITQFLQEHVTYPHIAQLAQFFAFFAIVTSFLGIGLGLFDFLSDGLHIKEKGWGKVTLMLLIALPTLFFATTIERIFFAALDSTGGYGDALLNGLIPVALVWVGRHKYGYASSGWLDHKPLLALLFTFYALVIITKLCTDVFC